MGEATAAIPKGEVITVSNMRHQSSDFHGKTTSQTWDAPDISRWKGRTFRDTNAPTAKWGRGITGW